MIELDIAIVGAGISGAHAAYRLKESHPDKQIALIESTHRIGGRLFSVPINGAENSKIEFGAMRFLDSQVLVRAVGEEMSMTSVAFEGQDPNNFLYLRGRRFNYSSLKNNNPYFLNDSERNKTPSELLKSILEKFIPGLNQTLSEGEIRSVLKEVRLRNKSLNDIGFWDFLLNIMSNEAYNYLMDAGGYFSSLTNWNALEAIIWFFKDFNENNKYLTFYEGYQELPNRLVENFKKSGGNLLLGHDVKSISVKEGELYIKVENGTGEIHLKTKRLILALPKIPLIKIFKNSNLLENELLKNLDSVLCMPAAKLVLGFDNPWWESLDIYHGRCDTDLPIRQIFYPIIKSSPIFDENSCKKYAHFLTATYNRGWNQATYFWQTINQGEIYKNVPTDNIFEDKSLNVSQAMVDSTMRQLRELHFDIKLPDPNWAIYKDWSKDIAGAGWHFWNFGINANQMGQSIMKPNSNLEIFICGEAYSSQQAWVEGALLSTERVLLQYFQVDDKYNVGHMW